MMAEDSKPKALAKLKLWFHRDLSHNERHALFSLFGMPIDEIRTSSHEQKCLAHILSEIAAAPVNASMGEEPVAWTGSGSLTALAAGREGHIWPSSADAHPIPLYTTPRPSSELVAALVALTDAFLVLNNGSFPCDRVTPDQQQYNDAMKEAYRLIGQPNTSDRTAKLAALITEGQTAGVEVRALEWTGEEHIYADGSGARCCDAEALSGFYIVYRDRDGSYTVNHSLFSVAGGSATLVEAKAAAQADFDLRIRSALVTAALTTPGKGG